jgi:transposase-like protein
MANVIHEARQGLTAALHEIEREEKRLLRALRSLEGRVPGRDRRRARARRSGPRKAKRAPKGKRREQFLAAVKEQPGITVAQAAKKVGVPASQLYPVARSLHKEKAISKRGAGYRIKAQTASTKSAKAS